LEADLRKSNAFLYQQPKGLRLGSGFAGTFLKGSEHNDLHLKAERGEVRTKSNLSGGVQGGISNGEELFS
jgi:chorismate synthase